MDTLKKLFKNQTSHYHDSVPPSLPHEFIRETATLDTLRLQLQEPNAHYELLSGPYNYEADLVDRSPEAIRDNALKLAVETLPIEVVDALEMEHEIRDNVAFHQPPSLETVILLGNAWDKLRTSDLEQIDDIEGAFAASIDFIHDRDTRDIVGKAYKNANAKNEPFHKSYIHQLSIGGDKLDQNLLEAKEKMEIMAELKKQEEERQAEREQQRIEREKRLGEYTTDQLATLAVKDDAQAVDMSSFFDD